jgi:hypothetical protein
MDGLAKFEGVMFTLWSENKVIFLPVKSHFQWHSTGHPKLLEEGDPFSSGYFQQTTEFSPI